MNKNKRILLGFLVFAFLTAAALSGCGGSGSRPEIPAQSESPLNNFSELLESVNLNDLSLTIYYMNPFIFTRRPLRVEDLIDSESTIKIHVDGNRLEEHIDLLSQIGNVQLRPIENDSYLNARIYYLFEAAKDGKILDAAMWMWGEFSDLDVLVNGAGVSDDAIFYDAIMPFLPENAAETLEEFLEMQRAAKENLLTAPATPYSP